MVLWFLFMKHLRHIGGERREQRAVTELVPVNRCISSPNKWRMNSLHRQWGFDQISSWHMKEGTKSESHFYIKLTLWFPLVCHYIASNKDLDMTWWYSQACHRSTSKRDIDTTLQYPSVCHYSTTKRYQATLWYLLVWQCSTINTDWDTEQVHMTVHI